MKDRKLFFITTLQFLTAMAVFAAIVYWHGQWNMPRWVGLCIGVPALAGLFVSRFQLGKSFAVTPQAKELITHGLYSKIRNPMYVFVSSFIVGFALATQLWWVLLVLIVLVPMQLIRSRQESQVLEQKFGDEYRAYRQSTWF